MIFYFIFVTCSGVDKQEYFSQKNLVSNTLRDSIIACYSMKIHFKNWLRIRAWTGSVDMRILESFSPTVCEQVGTALHKTRCNLSIAVFLEASGRLNSAGSGDQLTE